MRFSRVSNFVIAEYRTLHRSGDNRQGRSAILHLYPDKKEKQENHEGHEGGHEDKKMTIKLKSELSEEIEILYERIIGVAIEVHNQLGPGFLESVYEKAICYELANQGITYERQKEITILYKGQPISGQRLDLIVSNKLILEIKAVEVISPVHIAQTLSYLKATNLRAGLILNFKVGLMKSGIRRIVL